MPWRELVSSADKHIIADDRQHGTELFRQAVKSGFWFVAFEAFKRAHPPEHHGSLTAMWRSQAMTHSPLGRAKDDIGDKIADFMEELDQHTGAHGLRGAAWMDTKTRELIQYVQSLGRVL